MLAFIPTFEARSPSIFFRGQKEGGGKEEAFRRESSAQVGQVIPFSIGRSPPFPAAGPPLVPPKRLESTRKLPVQAKNDRCCHGNGTGCLCTVYLSSDASTNHRSAFKKSNPNPEKSRSSCSYSTVASIPPTSCTFGPSTCPYSTLGTPPSPNTNP